MPRQLDLGLTGYGKPLGVFTNAFYVMIVGDSKLLKDLVENPIANGSVYEFAGLPAIVLMRRDCLNEIDINARVKRWQREYPKIELPEALSARIKPRLEAEEGEALSAELKPYFDNLQATREKLQRS